MQSTSYVEQMQRADFHDIFDVKDEEQEKEESKVE